MRFVPILLLGLISGCDLPLPNPTFYTKLGSPVFARGEVEPQLSTIDHADWITADQASDIQSRLFTCLGAWYRGFPTALSDEGAQESVRWAYYVIVDSPTPCSGISGNCEGWQDNHELVVTAWRNGPYWSAFAHETIHYLQEFRLGIDDPKHLAPEWECQYP